MVEKSNETVGCLPYHLTRRYGSTSIVMPPLTMTMGPWIRYPPGQRHHNRLSHENEVIPQLIDALPPHCYFNQRFHPSQTNWLPLYWKGYDQNTRYTYVLNDLADLDKVYSGFENSVRRDIAKAQTRVTVEVSDDVELFYRINSYSFTKNGIEVPYSLSFVKQLDAACKQQGRRRILLARDASGEVVAANYLVWDDMATYSLMSGVDPNIRKNGAAKLLTWEAIKFAQEVSGTFDFEGSMLQAIERNNRTFGAVQVPYLNISKVNAVYLKLLRGFMQLMPSAPRG